jgi:hypothetical protein
MKNLEYQNWYLNRKSKEANILYERLSKLATGKDVILEQESIPAKKPEPSLADAKKVLQSSTAQSTLTSKTNTILGIDSGTMEGREFNKALTDFISSSLFDANKSPNPNKPDVSQSTMSAGINLLKAYANYVSGEAKYAAGEFSSLSRAGATLSTVGKDIKRRISDLFENISDEDKKILNEIAPAAIGAAIGTFVTAVANIASAVMVAVANGILALGFKGVSVIAFSYIMYKVLSDPKAEELKDEAFETSKQGLGAAKKGATAASDTMGAVQARTQQAERSQLQAQCTVNTPKWREGIPVKIGQVFRVATDPNNLKKQSVARVGKVYDNGSWDASEIIDCPKIEK